MLRRTLGRTGERISVLGFGGMVANREDLADVKRWVGEAVSRGINYFDVAPSYGNAEERLGPALKPYRDEVFLACKSLERGRKGAERQLEESLSKLQTDRLDLYQLHGIRSEEDVEQILGPGGALEALVEARKEGRTRYLGVTAHSEEPAIALLNAFEFDTVLYPLNWAAWSVHGFGRKIAEAARARGVGVLALKALAKGRSETPREERRWPKCWYDPVEPGELASLALRFTLNLPDVVSAVGPSHWELLESVIDTAGNPAPLTAEEEKRLVGMASAVVPVFPE